MEIVLAYRCGVGSPGFQPGSLLILSSSRRNQRLHKIVRCLRLVNTTCCGGKQKIRSDVSNRGRTPKGDFSCHVEPVETSTTFVERTGLLALRPNAADVSTGST